MDTTKAVTHVSLCAGYGGIDLGLKRAIPNLRTIAVSEIEAFACANLVSKMETGLMDAAPIWTDIKTFPWSEFRGRVDILSGGFPCQPFSTAGKRGGDEDPRHLFPYILEGIRRVRPAIVFLENVEGIISAKLAGDGWRDTAGTSVLLHVLRELERVGYRATAGVFSACEVGAPHQRKRVFILGKLADARFGPGCAKRREQQAQYTKEFQRGVELADSNCAGGGENWQPAEPRTSGVEQPPHDKRRSCAGEVSEGETWPSRPGEPQHGWEPPRVVGNTESRVPGVEEGRDGRESARAASEANSVGNASIEGLEGGRKSPAAWPPAGAASAASWQRQTELEVGGNSNGPSGGLDYAELCVACDNRTDELRLLGNGVVPATAEKAFITLLQKIKQNSF